MDAYDPTLPALPLADRLRQAQLVRDTAFAHLQALRQRARRDGVQPDEFNQAVETYRQADAYLHHLEYERAPQGALTVLALARDAVENPSYEPQTQREARRWEFARYLVQTGTLSEWAV